MDAEPPPRGVALRAARDLESRAVIPATPTEVPSA